MATDVYTRGTERVGGGLKLQANPAVFVRPKEREMLNRKMKPIAAAVGAAFATSFAANAIADEADPFEASLLEEAVILETSHKEGGCGEDKKGDDEAKCGEGKCGEGEGKKGDDEGKCGEGKCGEEGDDDSGESDEESEEE